MIFISLIIFLLFFYKIIKKNGFDISAILLLSYIITTIAGIVLFNQDIEYNFGNYSHFQVTLIPVLIYTLLICLCIYPFYLIKSNKKRSIKVISNIKFYNRITSLYTITFIILLGIFAEDIIKIFVIGNFGELREMAYEGELETAIDHFSGITRFIATIFTVIGDGAYFMIVFFFYSLCFLNNTIRKNISILIGSLSPVIIGFVNIDRSKTIFWIMLFAMTFILFKPYFSENNKKILRKIVLIFGGILLTYIISVTISRFGETENGTIGGLISYLGQPIINFCEIWNNLDVERFNTERLFPISNYFISGSNGANISQWVQSMYVKTGIHLNVFFSFIGMFLVDVGPIGAIFITFLIYIITDKILNTYRKKTYFNLASFIMIFAFATIIQCGIITYFYTTIARSVNFWIFVGLAFYFSKNQKTLS